MKARFFTLIVMVAFCFTNLQASENYQYGKAVEVEAAVEEITGVVLARRFVESDQEGLKQSNYKHVQSESEIHEMNNYFARNKKERDPVKQRLLGYSTELSSPTGDKNANLAIIRSILARTQGICDNSSEYNPAIIFEHDTVLLDENGKSGITRDFRQFKCCRCLGICLVSDIVGCYTFDYYYSRPDAPTDQEVLDFMREFKGRVDTAIATLNSQEINEIQEAAAQGVDVR